MYVPIKTVSFCDWVNLAWCGELIVFFLHFSNGNPLLNSPMTNKVQSKSPMEIFFAYCNTIHMNPLFCNFYINNKNRTLKTIAIPSGQQISPPLVTKRAYVLTNQGPCMVLWLHMWRMPRAGPLGWGWLTSSSQTQPTSLWLVFILHEIYACYYGSILICNCIKTGLPSPILIPYPTNLLKAPQKELTPEINLQCPSHKYLTSSTSIVLISSGTFFSLILRSSFSCLSFCTHIALMPPLFIICNCSLSAQTFSSRIVWLKVDRVGVGVVDWFASLGRSAYIQVCPPNCCFHWVAHFPAKE